MILGGWIITTVGQYQCINNVFCNGEERAPWSEWFTQDLGLNRLVYWRRQSCLGIWKKTKKIFWISRMRPIIIECLSQPPVFTSKKCLDEVKSGRGPGGSNGLVSSHPKCLIFQEVEETSLSFLPNRQLHSVSDLASTPSAALKLRREIKRESWDALILRSNTRTLKLPLPWTH